MELTSVFWMYCEWLRDICMSLLVTLYIAVSYFLFVYVCGSEGS